MSFLKLPEYRWWSVLKIRFIENKKNLKLFSTMNTIIQLLRGQLLEKEENHLFLTTFKISDNKSGKPWKEQFNYLMKDSKQ